MDKTIETRQLKNKAILIELLRKTPIVEVACDKSGVSRSTYYRWRQEDPEFAMLCDKALYEGCLLVNDLAESRLINAIKDNNMTATIYWLKNHHQTYKQRIEITTGAKDRLTEDEVKYLTDLLYDADTFKEGQKLLTSYVINGKISDKFALLILRMFISQMHAEDAFVRKEEVGILNEIMFRKNSKAKK